MLPRSYFTSSNGAAWQSKPAPGQLLRAEKSSVEQALSRGDRFMTSPRTTLTQPTSSAGQRKPYQKPAVRYERVFETSALTCGKVQTTQSGCHQNRKTS
jgi:hypothetical protein